MLALKQYFEDWATQASIQNKKNLMLKLFTEVGLTQELLSRVLNTCPVNKSY
jgi:hypothetical protein